MVPAPGISRDASVARRATFVTTSVSLGLVLLKTAAGVATGSVAVLASAVDSMLDFLVSLFNAFAVRGAEKPRDHEHNYGHGKLEGLAALFEGVLILGSAAFILREAILKFASPSQVGARQLNGALAAMGISMAASMFLVAYLRRAARRSRSLVLEADALHYRTDVWSNAAVLAGMAAIKLTGWTYADPIIACGIAAYIAWSAIPLVRNRVDMLMDRALPEELVERIRHIASTHSARARNVHELRTRRSGDVNFVEFHLVFDEEISLAQAHRTGDEIEARIRALEKTRWSISIHLDPVDDSKRDRKLAES
jgi:ferrous-iron efflux pump FieF